VHRTERVFESLLPPGTDKFGAEGGRIGTRRQLGRTLGSGRGARPTPVCTSICTTCGQVGGFTPVDMWRRRGTRGGHPPVSRSSPARTACTGCGHEKVTNNFSRRAPPVTAGRVAPAQQRLGTPSRPSSSWQQRTGAHRPAPL